MQASHPFLDHDGIIPFAHRGGGSEWPENTMPAFQAAVELGFRYLETDVHVTRDGVLLAFHDDVLDRVTDRSGAIELLDYAEVKSARVGGREPIPLFEELLSAWQDVRFNIDPKSDAAVDPLVSVLERHNALDRVCIGSFSGRRLGAIRQRLGDAVCTSMGPFDVVRLRAGSFGLPVGSFPANCVQVPVERHGLTVVDRRFVARAHSLGLPVHVWTIDNAAEIDRLVTLGVDGIMSGRPSVLKQVFESRGLWRSS